MGNVQMDSTKKVIEIPGYYYDSEKKKYFKITKEFLEAQRRKPKKDLPQGRHDHPLVLKELAKRSYGLTNPLTMMKTLRYSNMAKLATDVSYRKFLVNNSMEQPPTAEKIRAMSMKVNADGKTCILEVQDGIQFENRLFLCDVNVKRGSSEIDIVLLKKIQQTHVRFPERGSQVRIKTTSYCLNGDRTLYSTIIDVLARPGFIQEKSRIVYNINERSFLTYEVKKCNVTCTALNPDPLCEILFASGDNKRRLSIYCSSNLRCPYRTCFTISSPEVVQFFNQSPYVMIGTQTGHLQLFDYRMERPSLAQFMSQNYSIDHLQVLTDETYVLASDWSGQLLMYDLRYIRKFAKQYFGHVNNHSKLSFQVDSKEKHIFAVGSDSVLRMWDITSAKLERQVEVKQNCSYLPSLCYSSNWGGDGDRSEIICINGNMHASIPV